jgi:hypothetical protein
MQETSRSRRQDGQIVFPRLAGITEEVKVFNGK